MKPITRREITTWLGMAVAGVFSAMVYAHTTFGTTEDVEENSEDIKAITATLQKISVAVVTVQVRQEALLKNSDDEKDKEVLMIPIPGLEEGDD
jgi:hypothetical protein